MFSELRPRVGVFLLKYPYFKIIVRSKLSQSEPFFTEYFP